MSKFKYFASRACNGGSFAYTAPREFTNKKFAIAHIREVAEGSTFVGRCWSASVTRYSDFEPPKIVWERIGQRGGR